MISEQDFLKKIAAFAHFKMLNIPVQWARDCYPKFAEFEPTDLEVALKRFIDSEEKFDFSKLHKEIIGIRSKKLERQAMINKTVDEEMAKQFFNPTEYIEDNCDVGVCKKCIKLKYCKVRGKEWVKGINVILNKKLGRKGAEELISFMQKEFMGGVE